MNIENQKNFYVKEEDWILFVKKCSLFFGVEFQSGFKPNKKEDSSVELRQKNQKIYAVVNTTLLETTPPEIFWEYCLRDFGIELSLLNDSPWPDAMKNVSLLRLGLSLLHSPVDTGQIEQTSF